jgi:hypothetical protein
MMKTLINKWIKRRLHQRSHGQFARLVIFFAERNPFKEKRKFVYWQKPREVYGVAGCRHCGSDNVTYSEYVDLMWCYDCKREYYPEHWGIFDGPIPINLSHMMGIYFHRKEIATGKLIEESKDSLEEK